MNQQEKSRLKIVRKYLFTEEILLLLWESNGQPLYVFRPGRGKLGTSTTSQCWNGCLMKLNFLNKYFLDGTSKKLYLSWRYFKHQHVVFSWDGHDVYLFVWENHELLQELLHCLYIFSSTFFTYWFAGLMVLHPYNSFSNFFHHFFGLCDMSGIGQNKNLQTFCS